MSNEDENSSWLGPLPDELAEEGDMTGRRMLVATLTVIILAIFGGLIWYSYMEGSDEGPVPVVRADKSVVKIKPDTPGGLQVPDQDKRVFDRLATEMSQTGDRLESSAELPVGRPQTSDSDDKEAFDPAKQETEATREPAKEAPLVLMDDVPSEEIARQVAAIAPSVSGQTDKFLIQLGAFGQEMSAKKLWAKLQGENRTLLGGKNLDIMMVDLGKKGVLYRLRGGLFDGRVSADKACAALKAKKQPCIVVTR